MAISGAGFVFLMLVIEDIPFLSHAVSSSISMDQGNQERKSELGEVVKMKDSKILDLQFVVMDDIVFKNIPFEDRINTKLTLSDYDWMNYVFETEFRTKNQGRLKVEIKYYGSKESEMNVKRIDTIGVFEYTYFFETEMFEEYVSDL